MGFLKMDVSGPVLLMDYVEKKGGLGGHLFE